MAISHALIQAFWKIYPPDLEVYIRGGRALIERADIYRASDHLLPFTYPPFAAFLFQGLTHASWAAPTLLTFLSGMALARIIILSFCHVEIDGCLDRKFLFLIFAVALFLEPISMTFTLGQVNLILLWMVFESTTGDSKWRYVGIGIAGGIKLTPLIFLLPLTRRDRWGELTGNLLSLCGTLMIGWIAAPTGTIDFFADKIRDPKRVGGVEYISNQSLNGFLWRSLGAGGDFTIWLTCSVIVIAVASTITWTTHSRLSQFFVCAGAGVLVSPISWIHHWAWTLPLIIFLHRGRTTSTKSYRKILSWAFICLEISRITWLTPHENHAEFSAPLPFHLTGSLYTALALCLLFLLLYETYMQGASVSPSTSMNSRPDDPQGISREKSAKLST